MQIGSVTQRRTGQQPELGATLHASFGRPAAFLEGGIHHPILFGSGTKNCILTHNETGPLAVEGRYPAGSTAALRQSGGRGGGCERSHPCHGDGTCSTVGYLFDCRLRPAATSTVHPLEYQSQSSVSGLETRTHRASGGDAHEEDHSVNAPCTGVGATTVLVRSNTNPNITPIRNRLRYQTDLREISVGEKQFNLVFIFSGALPEL